AVRYLLGDPGWHVLLHAAEPVRPEAEHGAKEAVLQRPVVDDETNMDDVTGQRVDRYFRRRCGGLHEFDLVAFRVAHIEPTATVAARREWVGLAQRATGHPG